MRCITYAEDDSTVCYRPVVEFSIISFICEFDLFILFIIQMSIFIQICING